MSGIVCILKKLSLPVARSSTPRWPGQAMPPAGKRKAWEARLLPRVKIDGGPCVFLEVLIHVDVRINSQLMWIYPACFAQLLWHVAGELKHFSRNWPALGLCSAALSMRSEPRNGIWFTYISFRTEFWNSITIFKVLCHSSEVLATLVCLVLFAGNIPTLCQAFELGVCWWIVFQNMGYTIRI